MTQVGPDAYAAKLSAGAKKNVHATESEMMRSLDRLIRVVGFALIPVGCVLFYRQFQMLGMDFQTSTESTVAALIGMIPEGLYLLTSVAMAVSAMKLAQQKVLVQDMNCIETLARVDVLCVDKTGTITEPHMEVGEVVYLDEEKYAETVVTETLNAFYQSMEADNDTAGPWPRNSTASPCGTPPRPSPSPPPPSGARRCSPATAPLWWAPRSSSWGTATPI